MSSIETKAIQKSATPHLLPLVVDLDGTLTSTDTLIESLLRLAKQSPLDFLRVPWWLLKGKASFKNSVAIYSGGISPALLPFRESLLSYLREEKAKGRSIILATAAHHSIAESVASHLNLFDQVLATQADNNLKGNAKLKAIRQNVGEDFVYAGDNQADIPIWKAAKAAILVGVTPEIAKTVQQDVSIERTFSKENQSIAVWLKALRVHQWLKNLLLFVPMLTTFSFLNMNKLVDMVIAFLAFSLAASATYIVNDLGDLENDRAHPRKRLRPFASGNLPILHGLAVAGITLCVALIIASTISKNFSLMLLLYLGLTNLYSWILKEYVLIDVLMLSFLYTLRILTGSVVIGAPISPWLLAFSVCIFLSLALIKRCAELVSLQQSGKTATQGRDYRVNDLIVLWPLGIGAALSSVVVFGLFIHTLDTQVHYATPEMLWLVTFAMIYWLARLWLKTARGEMHDDPLVFAIHDFNSRITIFAMIATTIIAHFLALR